MHIGFLSYRISGTDGVSLEAERWKLILQRMGYEVTMIAGDLDRQGLLVPGIQFTHPKMSQIHQKAIDDKVEFGKLKDEVFAVADEIECELDELFGKFKFDRLIVANVLSLPIHFALAVAISKLIKKYNIPTVSRNHDFWWERDRYLHKESWVPFFDKFFPPRRNSLIKHVTINSLAQKEFKKRIGKNSVVIGDCFDFTMDSGIDEYAANWRKDLMLTKSDLVFLQATRIVPRKKIELAIDLIKRLDNPKIILILASYAGDEGLEYKGYLQYLIKQSGIRAKFIEQYVGPRRGIKRGKRIYTLWDCFRNCNFVTYPSEFEGFGNQFIEAVSFKKPIFINRYSVYKSDLEPLGFEAVTVNGNVKDETVDHVKKILIDKKLRASIVNKNYRLGEKYFSFEATRKKLERIGF